MEKILNAQVVYSGHSQVVVYDVELEDGSLTTREVVCRPNAVAIIAVNEKREIAMIKQYRIAKGRDTFEIPAGKIDDGEYPRDAAIRELREETGLIANTMEFRAKTFPSPGYSTEEIDIYFTDDFIQDEPSPDQGEFITFEFMPYRDFMYLIANGGICDGKTICASIFI